MLLSSVPDGTGWAASTFRTPVLRGSIEANSNPKVKLHKL